MPQSRIARRLAGSALLLLAAGVVALVVGFMFDSEWGWVVFSISLLLLLGDQLRQLYALGTWLESGEVRAEPRARGAWDELHALLHRSKREAARREAELARALNRWREAARALPDGVVILQDDRIEWCNDTALAHLDLDPARDVGHAITHLVRIPEFLAYLEGGDYAKPIELRPPDGRTLSVQVVSYGDGQRLVLSRDVTRFERMERTRREFVANVSHEMRTPLTVITGFLETLRDGGADAEETRHYLSLMTDQARRMERLVADLLTLSALESSPPPPMEEPIDMGALVERMGAEARALSAGRHKVEVEHAEGIELLGSEKEITSALGNLVSNAIRYTPQGGTVRLRWLAEPDGAAFYVEDTGIGISPEHIPRLTERFYRVDRGRSRETGGTGLGLAIVKHALGRHGATLDIHSTPGQGSRFTARFAGPRVRQ
ncbi:Phosphate regulon sensor protein PhoR [Usitatibacter rugosus]|uniref:Phosphate regulon sensor protein PhoR n=1 Tax=Usitatibacter rugosus TaxID=2732067 RepID=A0A6M4GY52_9PROT|nr:phosphate regulon sensor histidine kinase PhoR [Usitatibacter rugosus]QJR12211.1 Phosphate regulon sensor protein PhoR [Usitatibacter rugosus]